MFMFFSSPITSLYVGSNALSLDLRKELLAEKAILRPYSFLSSPLPSLLAFEDLANSSWKFALFVHPRFLHAGIVDVNFLEF